MEVWLWTVIGLLAVAVAALSIKIYLLKKAAKEIEEGFAERLSTDTNTLIDISSGDAHMKKLAGSINRELVRLRVQRRRFGQGDVEIKNAVTNISHDLRTPLTAICGYLDLLEYEETSKEAKRYLAVIRDRTEMLTQLTEELFCYSLVKSEENNLYTEPVSIGRVLEESMAAFYTALSARGITPKVQMPEEKVVRVLDASALRRVFSNLLHNVMKYSDGDLEVTLLETGEVIFANNSSGLDEVQTGRLFDRFYTVASAGNSTGLGLAIARTLVEQMKGTISAEYQEGRLYIRICFPDG